MSRRIVLFTPFSPVLGGGATILRSLLPELGDFQIDWLYTAQREESHPHAIRVGPPMTGGSLWQDMSRTVALWSGLPTRRFQTTVRALRARQPDGYWVVGHNEGALVARALARQGARVHLTIHDDVPDGILGRSVRYRYLAELARPAYHAALRSVRSLDFITERMRRHYQTRLGVDGAVIHPFIPSLPDLPAVPFSQRPAGELVVGHIGTIYAIPECRAFLQALSAVARQRGLRPRMLMVGLNAKFHGFAREFPGVVELVPDLPEDQAVERLATADLLYAMYPFDPRADVFRRTSLPTKLSTYVRCRRPVLAHTPRESSLADMVEAHGLGQVCDSMSAAGIEAALESTLDRPIPAQHFESAREKVYGTINVSRMIACLERLVPAPQT
jgi:hypothetical protein